MGSPPPDPEPGAELHETDRRQLRTIARDSIRQGLDRGEPLEPELTRLPPSLQSPGAAFVTLNLRGRLRGCVGSFEGRRSLAHDVAMNAYSAAFMDFRFPPVSEEEFRELEIHISVLTPLEPLPVRDRTDLLRRLRPGKDGLLLEDPPHRATFLPQVWGSLPFPEDFLRELLAKAGLPPDHWSPTLRFQRYGVEEF